MYPDILNLALIWATCLAFRVAPVLLSRQLGSDQWYWLLYAETLRKQKKLPIELPYVLEKGQWYPPVFPILLSLVPTDWVKRYGRLLAPAVDTLQLLLLVTLVQMSGNTALAWIAGGVYTLAPLPTEYNYQLNPRGMGALLLSIYTWGLYQWHIAGAEWAYVTIACGILICLLHKMTTQMTIILTISIGFWLWSPVAAWALLGIVGGAFLLSGGFYWKVLRAHADIVLFWNRNRDLLNAHQYHDSLLYAKHSVHQEMLHQKGIRGVAKHVRTILAANPFVICILPLAWEANDLSDPDSFALFWICVVYAWALLTSLVPQFRCLGAGVFYTYNALLPIGWLTASTFDGPEVQLAFVLATTCSVLLTLRTIRKRRTRRVESEQDLRVILKTLASLQRAIVFCVPFSLSEPTVTTRECR